MTGYLVDGAGRATVMPGLLQWSFKHTDGDPCDGFAVKCCLEGGLAEALASAAGFFAEEGGERVFTGVVDDYEICVDRKGLLAEVTGRGMAARLLDNQVVATEFQLVQLEDILRDYVRPYGVEQIRQTPMGALKRFVVETGYTCWQVLAGFCRHAGDVQPRFLADGTLVLDKAETGRRITIDQEDCISLRVLRSRFGRIAQQTLISTRGGGRWTAVDQEFLAQGGWCQKAATYVPAKLRATWRNPQQRIEDARRDKDLVEVILPGAFLAWPMDRVELHAGTLGVGGTYVVQCAESMGDETGVTCTLTLRE